MSDLKKTHPEFTAEVIKNAIVATALVGRKPELWNHEVPTLFGDVPTFHQWCEENGLKVECLTGCVRMTKK